MWSPIVSHVVRQAQLRLTTNSRSGRGTPPLSTGLYAGALVCQIRTVEDWGLLSLGWLPSSSPAAILTASRAGETVHQSKHSPSDRSRDLSAPCTCACRSAQPMQLLPTCTSILPGLEFRSVAVYITRQGASAFQTGLPSASRAIIRVLFALLTEWWLEKRSLGRSVYLSLSVVGGITDMAIN